MHLWLMVVLVVTAAIIGDTVGPRFLAFNAAGGLVWGAGFVVLGFVTGNSYKAVEKSVGRVAALVVLAVVLIAIVIWRIRTHRAESAREQEQLKSDRDTADDGE